MDIPYAFLYIHTCTHTTGQMPAFAPVHQKERWSNPLSSQHIKSGFESHQIIGLCWKQWSSHCAPTTEQAREQPDFRDKSRESICFCGTFLTKKNPTNVLQDSETTEHTYNKQFGNAPFMDCCKSRHFNDMYGSLWQRSVS